MLLLLLATRANVGHIRNCIRDTHITDQGLSLLSRLASVFADITAAVGTIAVDTTTTAAAAAAAAVATATAPLHAGFTNHGV